MSRWLRHAPWLTTVSCCAAALAAGGAWERYAHAVGVGVEDVFRWEQA